MKQKIIAPRGMINLIKAIGSVINIGDDQYLYFPYWIKTSKKENKVELISYDELPTEVKQYLTDVREGIDGE